jgi:hypothetical protein
MGNVFKNGSTFIVRKGELCVKKIVGVELIKLDTRLQNGLIYPNSVVAKACEDFNQGEAFGWFTLNKDMTLGNEEFVGIEEHAAFMIYDAEVEWGYLVVTIELLDNPRGAAFSEFMKNGGEMAVLFRGITDQDEDKVVTNLTIKGVDITDVVHPQTTMTTSSNTDEVTYGKV